jgi:hypothetical protein
VRGTARRLRAERLPDLLHKQVGTLQKEIDGLKGYFSETASRAVKRLMESKKWNSSIFQTKTGLNQGLFRKITTARDKQLKLPVIVSIGVGLGLPQEVSRKLINKVFLCNPIIASIYCSTVAINSAAISRLGIRIMLSSE